MLEVGQKVKYNFGKTDGSPDWREGVFKGWLHDDLGQHESQYIVQVGSNDQCFPANAVKPLYEIDDEVAIQHGKDNLDKLEALLNKALVALLPRVSGEVKRDKEEPHLIIMGGTLTVEPATIEVESLASFKEFPGWSVTKWMTTPGTRWEPPDVSDAEVGRSHHLNRVVQIAIDAIWDCLSAGFWEQEADNALYEQYLEDEKLAKEFYGQS